MSEAETGQREHYKVADLTVEVDAARVLRGGDEIPLPKLSFDLLVALLRRAPAVVTFDQLMDDVWGSVIVSPETVTQRVKLVRDALADDSKNPRYIAPVRGRGYRLVAAVERIDPAKPVENASDSPRWFRIAVTAAALTGVAVAAWLAGINQSTEPASPANPASIAILPFDNFGEDPENVAFTDGIHEDVLTRVSQISSLRVISRTSVEALARERSVPDIAEQLGVASVLEGSVRRVDDNVRISVQLIDAGTDTHIWAQTYDRELSLENVFAIQSDIAGRVAEGLRATLSSRDSERLQRVQTTNFAAYEAYQLGRQRMRNRNTAELQQARVHFESAIELDPEFAAAYLGLAQTLRLLSSYGTLSASIAGYQGAQLVDRAIELDDDLGEAFAERGVLRTRLLQFDAAEQDFLRAQLLSSSHSDAYLGFARMLAFRNRNEEALDNFRIAQQLDPLSGSVNADLAMALVNTGRYDAALEQYRHTVDVAPDYAGGYRGIADMYWTVFARPDEAYAWRLQILELDPGDPVNPAILGLICLDLGDPDLAERWIERALEFDAERRRPLWAAEALHLFRGESERSLEYAKRVLEIDPPLRFTVTHLRNVDARAGQIDEALDRYRSLYPEVTDDLDPVVEFYNYIAAIDIAGLRQQQGDSDRASMLLDRSLRALDDMRRLGPRGYAIADVEIYALQGKRELALATLREAVDTGWRMQWWFWLDHSPNLDSIRDDPRFAEIRGQLAAESAEYLARVRSSSPRAGREPEEDTAR